MVAATTTTTGTTTTTTTPATIASGVTISGVEVGDLTSDQAFAAVTASFARPLTLVVPRHRLAVAPARIGAMAAVRAAVARALTVPADTALKLRVILSRKGTQRYLDAVAKRFDREPVDSQLAAPQPATGGHEGADRPRAAPGAGDERDLHGARDEHAAGRRRSSSAS